MNPLEHLRALKHFGALKHFIVCAALALACAPAQARIFNQAELDALVAPIALYPDSLVAQILEASIHPEEVALAAAWSRANPHLKGDEALAAAEHEPWDEAVKSLLAFPEVLERMDESPQWTRDLGEAYLGQEPHVMETVQALRRRAQATGNLQSDGEYAVEEHAGVIVVEPRTEVVYVRYYDPYIVYGPWWWPSYRPVFWQPWPARRAHITHFHVAPRKWHKPLPAVKPHRSTEWKKHHAPQYRAPQHRPPQHRPKVTVREYRRVPESRRQPIVQSHPRLQNAPAPRRQQHRMPAPPRFSQDQGHRGQPQASFQRRQHSGGWSDAARSGRGWNKQR